MKVEKRCLIYSLFNNLLISIIKVFGGVIFGLSSLFADGMHTFVDFVTDVFALLGAKISRKRPTKLHPFGFGKFEYIINLLIGVVVVLLGLFILVRAFSGEAAVPPLTVIILLIITLVLKFVAVNMLRSNGEKINSGILITASKESMTDIYSTVGVIIIVLLMQLCSVFPFLIYTDCIGTVIISLIVIRTGIPIIKHNVMSLIGEVDENLENVSFVETVLNDYKRIRKYKIQLIEYGSYYTVHLTLDLSPSITLKEINELLNLIKKDLKKIKKIKIKYVTIDVVPVIKK